MSILEQLVSAFPQDLSSACVDEDFILANPNVMELSGQPDLLDVVPAYIRWCTKYPAESNLVSDYTLAALAEYGRCNNPTNSYLNFRHLCSPEQQEAVVAFLAWASKAIPFHHEAQLARALHNWKSVANFSSMDSSVNSAER
ncbi:MAG: hypothetical protein ABIQ70_09925 [Dokdonella sp.]